MKARKGEAETEIKHERMELICDFLVFGLGICLGGIHEDGELHHEAEGSINESESKTDLVHSFTPFFTFPFLFLRISLLGLTPL